MATTQKIPALNPYVNDTKLTDSMIKRVELESLPIGATRGQLSKSDMGQNFMAIQHSGGKK